MIGPSSPWFPSLDPRPDAPIRLYLFPPAGAGASVYASWRRLLPATIEPCPVQLPGRHSRSGEPGPDDLGELVESLQDELEIHQDGRPFAFFGHSFGALLAYLVTMALEKSGTEPPRLLAVSGWSPSLTTTDARRSTTLSAEDFAREVSSSGAVPPGVLDDEGLRQLVFTALRSDLALVAQYLDDGRSVTTPCVVYSAAEDTVAAPERLAEWPRFANDLLGIHTVPGPHFAVFAEPRPVLADLSERIALVLS